LSIGLSEIGCANDLSGARRRCLEPNIAPGDEMSTPEGQFKGSMFKVQGLGTDVIALSQI
jgi:hypothetical protein